MIYVVTTNLTPSSYQRDTSRGHARASRHGHKRRTLGIQPCAHTCSYHANSHGRSCYTKQVKAYGSFFLFYFVNYAALHAAAHCLGASNKLQLRDVSTAINFLLTTATHSAPSYPILRLRHDSGILAVSADASTVFISCDLMRLILSSQCQNIYAGADASQCFSSRFLSLRYYWTVDHAEEFCFGSRHRRQSRIHSQPPMRSSAAKDDDRSQVIGQEHRGPAVRQRALNRTDSTTNGDWTALSFAKEGNQHRSTYGKRSRCAHTCQCFAQWM